MDTDSSPMSLTLPPPWGSSRGLPAPDATQLSISFYMPQLQLGYEARPGCCVTFGPIAQNTYIH